MSNLDPVRQIILQLVEAVKNQSTTIAALTAKQATDSASIATLSDQLATALSNDVADAETIAKAQADATTASAAQTKAEQDLADYEARSTSEIEALRTEAESLVSGLNPTAADPTTPVA